MGLIFSIAGIVWLVQHLSKWNLERQIKQANQDGNAGELQRLNRLRNEREQNKRRAQRTGVADQRYFDAIMVLDAAEHGVFVPNPADYFDHLGENTENEEEYRNNYDEDRGNDYEDNSDDDQGDQYEYPEDY
jgi:hypothetical protein